jgi:hypothetical protein
LQQVKESEIVFMFLLTIDDVFEIEKLTETIYLVLFPQNKYRTFWQLVDLIKSFLIGDTVVDVGD